MDRYRKITKTAMTAVRERVHIDRTTENRKKKY